MTETYQNYAATSFKQSYLYDRYGNRRIDLANTDPIGGGVTRLDFKALTATNRLVAQSDTTGDETSSDQMRYDKAGNLVYDNFSPAPSQRGSMTYDAENRMVTAVNGTQRYRYDANGRRVKRLVGQTGANGEVWQVYSPDGELLAEYPKQGAAATPTKEYGYQGGQLLVVFDSTEAAADDKLKWLVADHLGSTRMIVNKSGSLAGIKRRDYLPFGEELASTIGHRGASGSGYALDDKPRMKFGSHERDSESGLDFMQARFYSNVQGRFTSPDEPFVDQYEGSPQSWNLYSYVRNNPLRLIDPLGQSAEDPQKKGCLDNGACYNPESGQYEIPGEPSGGIPLVVDIIDNYDPFLERVFMNQMVEEVTKGEKGIAFATTVFPTLVPFGPVRKLGKIIGTLAGLTQEERAFVQELIAAGKTVQIVPRGAGETADFIIDGVLTELKTINSLGKNTVKNAIQKAASQAPGPGDQILIDARQVALTPEQAIKEILRAEGNVGSLKGKVTIVTQSGAVTW